VTVLTATESRTGTPPSGQALPRLVGAGLLVAVGYLDPGNWATDIAGGSAYRYLLLGVVIGSSVLAIVFQMLVARVAIATGDDIATLTRRILPAPLANTAWLAGEAAILATAIAELAGGAIALRLLFDLPLAAGLVTSAAAALGLLLLAGERDRPVEAVVAVLVAIVAAAFVVLMAKAEPSATLAWSDVAGSGSLIRDRGALLLALGILGATLMPHNLYLHSGLLARRGRSLTPEQRPRALRIARHDIIASLGVAMLINAAILAVAAASLTGPSPVDGLAAAHALMADKLGGSAALIFAVALFAAGLSSAITGVMAGRLLTAGFTGRDGSTWRRGTMTRIIAVVIALGAGLGQGTVSADTLLVASQVVLGLALPFALIPLVWVALRDDLMGRYALRRASRALTVSLTGAITAVDIYLVWLTVAG